MARRPIIRYGDVTTHGGTVVSADPTFTIYGKNVARVGDMVTCPSCKGTFPILTGASHFLNGREVARQADVTACGAKLIASQSTATIDDGSEASTAVAAASARHQALAASSTDSSSTYAIRFRALDHETGEPIPDCFYILKRENGARNGGITDHEGFTEIVETIMPEQIGVHFMFKASNGETIDQKDLNL